LVRIQYCPFTKTLAAAWLQGSIFWLLTRIPALAHPLCDDSDGDGYTNLTGYLNYLAEGGTRNR